VAVVKMLVANSMLDELPEALLLLKARERDRRPSREEGVTVVTLEVDGAPDGAVSMTPAFERVDGVVRLKSINWHYTA
jgi:hypothetical protein